MLVEKNSVNTREKIGSSAKKLLLFAQQAGKVVHRLSALVAEVSKHVKQTKKCIDLVFMLEQVGFLTQTSYNTLIYTGLMGVATRYLQFLLAGRRAQRVLAAEDLEVEGKSYSVRSSKQLGKFLAELLFQAVSSPTLMISKGLMDQAFDEMGLSSKENSPKSVIAQSINLLAGLNLIEKNETNEVITYIGPPIDLLQENSLLRDSAKVAKLAEKEPLYWQLLFDSQPVPEAVPEAQESMPLAFPLSNFPEVGYAVIMAKLWEYIVRKPAIIIGRGDGPWEVDLALDRQSVSRQHVLILFDFGQGQWMARCLSRKNGIRVDNLRLREGQPDARLKHKSVLRVGGERMVFLLPEKREATR